MQEGQGRVVGDQVGVVKEEEAQGVAEREAAAAMG